MRTHVLRIIAISLLGVCLLCSLAKMSMKNENSKKTCDNACGILMFVALALIGVSQLKGETEKYSPAGKITFACTPILKTGGAQRLETYKSITGGSIADTWGNLSPQTLTIKTSTGGPPPGGERDCYLNGMDDNKCTNLNAFYKVRGCTPSQLNDEEGYEDCKVCSSNEDCKSGLCEKNKEQLFGTGCCNTI